MAQLAVVLVLVGACVFLLPSARRRWRAGAAERQRVIAEHEGHLVTLRMSVGKTLVLDESGVIRDVQPGGFTFDSDIDGRKHVPMGQVRGLRVGRRELGPW